VEKTKITTILAGIIGGIIVLLVYESNIVVQVEDNLNTVSMHPCELAANEVIDMMGEMAIMKDEAKNLEIDFSERENYLNAIMEMDEKSKSVTQKMFELKCNENPDDWFSEELIYRYDQSASKFPGSGYSPLDNPFRKFLNTKDNLEGDLNTVSMHPCELGAHELLDMMDELTIMKDESKNLEIDFSERENYLNAIMEMDEKSKSVTQKTFDLKCNENTDDWVSEELIYRYDQSASKFSGSDYSPLDNPFRKLLYTKGNLEQDTEDLSIPFP